MKMRGFEESVEDFDDALDIYFSTSRRYRATLRKGMIVLLDDDRRVYDFLMFLRKECDLDIGIVLVKTADIAKSVIKDAGVDRVKSVLIDSDMIGNSLNGDSLTHWVLSNHSNIPLYVLNCGQETRKWIRKQTSRIGVFGTEDSLASVAEGVGFPVDAKKVALQYA